MALPGLVGCKGPKQLSEVKEDGGSVRQMEITWLYVEASKQKILGNFEDAISLYKKCLDLDKANHAAMYELAGLLDYAGEHTAAIVLTENAVKTQSENIWYHRQLAGMYGNVKRFSDAAAVFQTIVKMEPDKMDNYIDLATALLHDRQLTQAIRVFDQAEAKMGKDFRLTMDKHRIYMELEHPDQAISELESFLRQNPDDVAVLHALAETYKSKGNKVKPLEIYDRILKLQPDHGRVHLSLSDYYERQNEDERSREELKKAFESKRVDAHTKAEILQHYYQATETHKELLPFSYELAQTFVRIHPDDPRAFSTYAHFQYRDRQLEAARDNYKRATEIDNSHFIIWNQVLLLDSELSDYNDMAITSAKAIELFPNQPLLYLFNGMAQLQKNQYDDAIGSLENGILLVVDNQVLLARFYATLGDAYHEKGEHTNSDNAYDNALKIDPDNVYVLNNYSYYLSLRKKQLDKAATMSERANQLQPNSASFQDTYGWILYWKAQYETAATWLRKAMNNGGDKNGVILEHYGDVLFRMGNKNEALHYWNKAKTAGNASEFIDRKIADQQLYE